MTFFLGQNAGNSCQTPVLIGFVKFRCLNALRVQNSAKLLELSSVSNRQVNVAGMVVVGTTELIGVFDASVGGLDRLLRERNVAPRDGVQVSLGRNLDSEFVAH